MCRRRQPPPPLARTTSGACPAAACCGQAARTHLLCAEPLTEVLFLSSFLFCSGAFKHALAAHVSTAKVACALAASPATSASTAEVRFGMAQRWQLHQLRWQAATLGNLGRSTATSPSCGTAAGVATCTQPGLLARPMGGTG